MFHFELGKMFAFTRAGMLENADGELKALSDDSWYDYLLTFATKPHCDMGSQTAFLDVTAILKKDR